MTPKIRLQKELVPEAPLKLFTNAFCIGFRPQSRHYGRARATGQPEQLAFHANRAMDNGLTTPMSRANSERPKEQSALSAQADRKSLVSCHIAIGDEFRLILRIRESSYFITVYKFDRQNEPPCCTYQMEKGRWKSTRLQDRKLSA
jgi:hypothetical protein